ncbi:DNA-binding transcriptional regulator, ArsR family [Kordiimonas lacus]|uniref:DNA-binding transcriptional regulator, ArsR family n=1 Tax=Kordiimonas lacus TaxID=637679 RepID=A0A1G7B752_9PROT|nr:DNA-binding transcriptional regulator, ArsR family [Kordiimonas lacus]
MSAVFKALSDDTRLLVLEELRKRDNQSLFEICVRVIEQHDLSLSRQALSRHLNVLEAAGLITTEWSGRTKVHTLNRTPIGDHIQPWMKPFLE